MSGDNRRIDAAQVAEQVAEAEGAHAEHVGLDDPVVGVLVRDPEPAVIAGVAFGQPYQAPFSAR